MSHPSRTPSKDPVHQLVIYRPKAGQLDALEAIVRRHGPALRQTGLITDAPVLAYRGCDIRKPEAGTFLVETFTWRDGAAPDVAHQTPEIMTVWETMGPHLDDMTLITLDPIG